MAGPGNFRVAELVSSELDRSVCLLERKPVDGKNPRRRAHRTIRVRAVARMLVWTEHRCRLASNAHREVLRRDLTAFDERRAGRSSEVFRADLANVAGGQSADTPGWS